MKTATTILMLAILLCTGALADEAALELTVYNNNLALVKETRELTLKKGVQEFQFLGVPERLLPETVHFKSITDPTGTVVLEQNYRFDLLDRSSLLERYRGQEVETLIDGQWQTVRLLSPGSPAAESYPLGRILEVAGKIHIEGFILPALPEGLLLKPTLVWLLDARRKGQHQVEVDYLTEGLSWRADYVTVVDTDNRMDLVGWVTLNNTCGRDFQDARLKLVAGDVHRATRQTPRYNKGRQPEVMASMGNGFAQEEFFEYHLYTLGRPTTVLDREQKQVELLRQDGIKAQRKYVFTSSQHTEDRQPRAVSVVLEFANTEGEGPGVPLPKGIVRVYQADSQGQLQFAGEDNLPHTPAGEQVRLKLGEAFDLRGERLLLNVDQSRNGKIWSRSYRITLRNHKQEDVEISVIEGTPGYSEWTISQSSHEWDKLSARQIEIQVTVPAKGETIVEYTLRNR